MIPSTDIYLFKVNSENTKAMYEIYLKLTIKTKNDINDVVVVFLLLTLNKFRTFLWCFHCWVWTSKCWPSSRQEWFQRFKSSCSFRNNYWPQNLGKIVLSKNSDIYGQWHVDRKALKWAYLDKLKKETNKSTLSQASFLWCQSMC